MQQRNTLNYIERIWHYLLIYTAISFGGMALPTVIGREPFVLLTFFIGLFYIVTKKTERTNRFIYFLTILACSLIITFIGSDLSIGSILSTLAAFMFTYGIIACDPHNFLQHFLKVIFIISVVSIILLFHAMPIVLLLSTGCLQLIQNFITEVIHFVLNSKHGLTMQDSICNIFYGVSVTPKPLSF